MNISKENKILIFSIILSLFLSAFLYITRYFENFDFLVHIGSVLILLITISNDLLRLTKINILKWFCKNLHFWGIISFCLILPHTAETGQIARDIASGKLNENPAFFVVLPLIAFVIIFMMTCTSIQKFQPKWWKNFHRIVWICLPLISIHIYDVGHQLFGLLFLFPMLICLYGLIKSNKYYKIFLIQFLFLIIGCVILISVVYQQSTFLIIIKFLFYLLPLIYLKLKNKNIFKVFCITMLFISIELFI